AVASVPASVTVTPGATSATFTMSTTPVSLSTGVMIFATYGGVTTTAVLTVIAPALSALSLNPTSVSGGAASTGTVTLSGPAPNGGVVVGLSSGNAAVATVPASVTVAAGATSASFTVSTIFSCATASATIAASYGGVIRSSVLTVILGPV